MVSRQIGVLLQTVHLQGERPVRVARKDVLYALYIWSPQNTPEITHLPPSLALGTRYSGSASRLEL
jgi:hypothetical protein